MVWGLGGGTRPPSPKHTHRPQSLSRTKGRTLPQGPRQAEQVNQGNLPWDPDREPGSPAKHRQQSIRNGLSRYSTVLGGWRWWLRVDQQQGHTAQREDSSSRSKHLAALLLTCLFSDKYIFLQKFKQKETSRSQSAGTSLVVQWLSSQCREPEFDPQLEH